MTGKPIAQVTTIAQGHINRSRVYYGVGYSSVDQGADGGDGGGGSGGGNGGNYTKLDCNMKSIREQLYCIQ